MTPRVSSTTSCKFVPAGDSQNVSATFALNRHTATVVNRLNGSVVSTNTLPDAFVYDCGNTHTDCTDTFDYGTPVTLQATPGDRVRLRQLDGVTCLGGATSATCAFVLKANTTVTPNYRVRTVVTVVKAGSGTAISTGISCGADCSEAIFDGKSVILTATPAVGSQFVGFGGACVSSTKSCTFVPAGDSQNVSATFRAHPLHPHRGGQEQRQRGPERGRSGGLRQRRDRLHLDPRLRDGGQPAGHAERRQSLRSGWAGAICTGGAAANPCVFTLKANTTVTPTFRDVSTVSLTKTGQGTVVSTPAGISCGVACGSASFDFTRNVIVKLTRRPPPPARRLSAGVAPAPARASAPSNASVTSVPVTATFTP